MFIVGDFLLGREFREGKKKKVRAPALVKYSKPFFLGWNDMRKR
jgi:hypothetical protein